MRILPLHPGPWLQYQGRFDRFSIREAPLLTIDHSLISTQSALTLDLKPQWLQIWHLASRNLSNPNVSRSAAHLLNAILSSKILQDADVAELIDATLFSNGLNGPIGMSDAALSLWFTIIAARSTSGQSVAQQTVIRLVSWVSSNYVLSMSPAPFLSFHPLNELQHP